MLVVRASEFGSELWFCASSRERERGRGGRKGTQYESRNKKLITAEGEFHSWLNVYWHKTCVSADSVGRPSHFREWKFHNNTQLLWHFSFTGKNSMKIYVWRGFKVWSGLDDGSKSDLRLSCNLNRYPVGHWFQSQRLCFLINTIKNQKNQNTACGL